MVLRAVPLFGIGPEGASRSEENRCKDVTATKTILGIEASC